MLSLAADGVGSKWMTGALGAAPEAVLECVGASADEKLMGAIWYGYPAKALADGGRWKPEEEVPAARLHRPCAVENDRRRAVRVSQSAQACDQLGGEGVGVRVDGAHTAARVERCESGGHGEQSAMGVRRVLLHVGARVKGLPAKRPLPLLRRATGSAD